MDEKSSSPLFAVGGGEVVTNDWCITVLPCTVIAQSKDVMPDRQLL